MKWDQLNEIHKESAAFSKEFYKEIEKVVDKSFKKNPRMTLVLLLHLPINAIMPLIERTGDAVFGCFPELPQMFARFVRPFVRLEEEWGKIPGKEFAEKYYKIYESKFDEFFINEKDKESFMKWFEKGKKNETPS